MKNYTSSEASYSISRLLFYPLSKNIDFSSCLNTEQTRKLTRSFRITVRFNLKQRLRLKKGSSKRSAKGSGLSSKALFSLTPLLLLQYTFNAHALSASTANTIEGSEPYLLLSDGTTKLTNLNELLGFSMPKRDGSAGREQIDASMAGTTFAAPLGMTYNDVVVLVTADGNSYPMSGVTVGDDDGDASIAANTWITGTMKATWYDGDAAIPAANLGNTLTSCGGPYTLKLEIPTLVSANTTYGVPNTTPYGSSTGVTYTFTSNNQGICYLQPLSMQIYPDTPDYLVKYGPGYNAATWQVGTLTASGIGFTQSGGGFKKAAGFPTTGFENAVFSFVGSGSDQSKYRCSTDSPSKISLSGTASTALGANCKVNYISATKAAFTAGGTPTIKMEYNRGTAATPNWVLIDSYTIPIPSKWAIGKNGLSYANTDNLATSTKFAAFDACRVVVDGHATPATTYAQVNDMTTAGKAWRQKYLYRRDEFTNSPYADHTTYPEENSPEINITFFARDVDGTFMGEWGNMQDYNDPSWAGMYWTAEVFSNQVFFVYSNGSISVTEFYTDMITWCRGD